MADYVCCPYLYPAWSIGLLLGVGWTPPHARGALGIYSLGSLLRENVMVGVYMGGREDALASRVSLPPSHWWTELLPSAEHKTTTRRGLDPSASVGDPGRIQPRLVIT